MFKKTITKRNLSEKIHQDLGFSKTFTYGLVDNILEIIVNQFKDNKNVKITNFGTFKIYNKKARLGRNPKTKEIANISARKVISFHSSKEIKKKINLKKNG